MDEILYRIGALTLVVLVAGVAGLLLGSTANGVVAHAACPVVVLPDPTAVVISRPLPQSPLTRGSALRLRR